MRALLGPEASFSGGVAWNVASLAVLGVAGVLVNLLIGRYAGAAALGVFNQAYAVYIFASQLAVGGVQFSVLSFLSDHTRDRDERRDIALSGLLLATALSAPVAAGVALGAPLASRLLASPGVHPALLIAAPGLLFFSLNKILLAALNGLRWMRAFAVFNALRFVLILAGVVTILGLGWPSELLVGALSAAECVLLLALAVFVQTRVLNLRVGPALRRWVRRHADFGFRSFMSGTLSELNTRVDVLVLGVFLDDRAVGIYSLAAIFAEGFNQLPYVVRNNLDPLLGNRFADGAVERIESYARRIRRVFWPAMAAAGLAAVIVYPLLVGLFFPSGDFAASRGVFAILALGVVVSSGHRPLAGILIQGGRPGAYTLLLALVVAGNLAGNVALIPRLGIHGAAVATAAMLVLEAALIVVFSRRLFGVRLAS